MTTPFQRFLKRKFRMFFIASGCTLGLGLVPPAALSPVAPQIAMAAPARTVVAPSAASAASIGLPTDLAIPRIGIHTSIEHLGLTVDRKLDVPVNRLNVGWYKLGPRPGEIGNAVIDGHLTVPRADGIFRHLNDLRSGDKIYVTDDRGQRQEFRVRRKMIYDVASAPMLSIFGPADGAHLNLITCAGKWSTVLNHYDKRLIVYADVIH